MRTPPLTPHPSLALRMALIEGSRIVDERTLTHGVLAFDRGHLVEGTEGSVRFCADGRQFWIEGRVTGRLRSAGGAVEPIDTDRLLLLRDREGRIDVGEHALLFQVIEVRGDRGSRGLPAELRGLPIVDGRFTSVAIASLLLHFSFVVTLEHLDSPYAAAVALPTRAVELMLEAPRPPPAPPEVPVPVEAKEEPITTADAEDAPRSIRGERSDGAAPRSNSSPRTVADPRLADEIGAAVERQLLGAFDAAGLSGAPPTFGEIVSAMDESEPNGTICILPRPPRDTTVEGIGALSRVPGWEGARSEGSPLEPEGPRSRVALSELIEEPSEGVFDPRRPVTEIGRRLGALRRCYEHQLSASGPELEGSIDVAFTILESGEVTAVRALENTTGSDALATCVVRVLERLPRFVPGPTGGSVRFTYPLVFEQVD